MFENLRLANISEEGPFVIVGKEFEHCFNDEPKSCQCAELMLTLCNVCMHCDEVHLLLLAQVLISSWLVKS